MCKGADAAGGEGLFLLKPYLTCGRTENKMAKKYKNTVHKNPFREDRPKKNIPWKLIGIIAAFLALVLIVTLVIDAVFGVRKLKMVTGGGLYDKRSGVTYKMAPLCYQPVTLYKKDVYARFNKTNLYKIQNVSADKMISTSEDGFYEIYYNKEYPLPSLFEMNVNAAIVCDVGTLVVPVGPIDEAGAKALVELLKNESLYCDYPENTSPDSTKYIYFTSPDYPHLYYYVHYFKGTDGARYVYDSAYERCVPIGDLLIDSFN